MKRRKLQFITITLIAGLHCVSGQDVRSERINVSERNWNNLLQYLAPVLKSDGGVGRLYYRAECLTARGDGILFPWLELVTPEKAKTGLAAIQDIFRKEEQVRVTEDRSGIHRISIGDVSYELLRTKIHVLTFTPSERYNVQEAISAVEGTKEVRSKMRELKLQHPPTVFSGGVVEPAAGLPHLPKSLKNVTMDEALDQVAQTFGQLISYGECVSGSGTRLCSINCDYIR
jgi:hypothetical protein